MNVSPRRRLQCAAAGVLIVSYAVLSYHSNAAAKPDLGAALALAPVTLFALVVIWRSSTRPAALALTAAGAAGLVAAWPGLRRNFSLLSFMEESGAYFVLAATFALSLRRPRIALCTRLADRVHGPLSSAQVRYTRRVTVAWAIFFCVIAAASLGLFRYDSIKAWAFFANFCVAPLVAAMFVAEQVVRKRVLPEVRNAGLLTTMRVYFRA